MFLKVRDSEGMAENGGRHESGVTCLYVGYPSHTFCVCTRACTISHGISLLPSRQAMATLAVILLNFNRVFTSLVELACDSTVRSCSPSTQQSGLASNRINNVVGLAVESTVRVQNEGDPSSSPTLQLGGFTTKPRSVINPIIRSRSPVLILFATSKNYWFNSSSTWLLRLPWPRFDGRRENTLPTSSINPWSASK
jgi:hypothetical protein